MDVLVEKQLMNLIENLVCEKIVEDENFLRFSFYEVRVKGKVTSENEEEFLILANNKLTNMGYKVYFQEQEFRYNNTKRLVQPNELLIAIKER